MNALRTWLTLKGRLSRGQFWLRLLFLWAVFYGVWEGLGLAPEGVAVWLINLPMAWLLLSLSVRRLHDRNHSGKWLLAALLPVAGAAWLAWQLAMRPGMDQANQWGEDPLQVTGDFLTVQ